MSCYTSVSPYSFALNNPILFIDPDGNIVVISHRDPETKTVVSVQFGADGKLYDRDSGKEYTRNNEYIRQVQTALNNMLEFNNEIVTTVIMDLVDGTEIHSIQNFDFIMDRTENKLDQSYNIRTRDKGNDPSGSLTKFVPDLDRIRLGYDYTDEEILGHELKHGYNRKHNMQMTSIYGEHSGVVLEEIDAVNFQNVISDEQKRDPRTEYGGVDISKDLTPPDEYKNVHTNKKVD